MKQTPICVAWFDYGVRRLCLMVCSVLATIFSPTAVGAQVVWAQVPLVSPSPDSRRHGCSMCYDSWRKKVVLFGGSTVSSQTLSDTWEWDGKKWEQRYPVSSPPSRHWGSMAFDSRRGRAVLYGGVGQSQDLSDTWEWDGSNWQQVGIATSPALTLLGPGMAYDEANGVCVLAMGDYSGTRGTRTWLWDGSVWTHVRTSASPPPRLLPGFAYLPPIRQLVLFGGADSLLIPLNDTWTFDGKRWQQVPITNNPPVRYAMSFSSDTQRDRIVMFGGFGPSSSILIDTWELDGRTWAQRTPLQSPIGRANHSSVYVEHVRRTFMFGFASSESGYEYYSVANADYRVFGRECAGTFGPLDLRSETGLPWLGDSLVQSVEVLPVGGVAAFLVGSSKSTWFGRFALPLDLSSFGMPGCDLLVQGDTAVGGQPFGASRSHVRLQMPLQAATVGSHFYTQALVLDPTANPMGLVTSRGADCVIGAR